ncbi:hypothetical protein [Sporosalibacterium faouarense]|uniref:hypothetical protein n=1 Tax=Sporosalibacterium faouarense TaxID=516123 RepID=UPI00141C38A3|nr:hypothetical protein [Sporosalibacterium faouarense]MTI49837.1 hypothetical protein [Bacillota bacterium]
MLNKFKEIRTRRSNGIYNLELKFNEEDFFQHYSEANSDVAKEILGRYLVGRKDLGKAENISIIHNQDNHTVDLITILSYKDILE